MNNIILRYLIDGFLKNFLKVILFFFCFGIILNLFEEIEFFKDLDVSIFVPLLLTLLFIPSIIIQLLPFIIFVTSMKFIMDIRNNKDLLNIKVFGFSNLKIFFILALTSFFIGWIVLFLINPVTSSMSQYYDKTKSSYSKDIDHLVSFNKNGLWIKENLTNGQRIISAERGKEKDLKNLIIYNFDEKYSLKEKIFSLSANIEKNQWVLYGVQLLQINDGQETKKIELENMTIESKYTIEKIINLFKNFDTISFVDLVVNYNKLLDKGYNKIFLNQSLHAMLSMPFFLFIMTALASILIMNTLKQANKTKIIIFGIFSCVIIYYLKDLSIALGQTNRIPITLAYWIPIIIIGLFSFVGILQINEK